MNTYKAQLGPRGNRRLEIDVIAASSTDALIAAAEHALDGERIDVMTAEQFRLVQADRQREQRRLDRALDMQIRLQGSAL